MTADFFKDSNMDVLNKHLTAFLGAAMTGGRRHWAVMAASQALHAYASLSCLLDGYSARFSLTRSHCAAQILDKLSTLTGAHNLQVASCTHLTRSGACTSGAITGSPLSM
jgi:hypothetical protein